jgi:hypothetical protein
MGKRPRRRVTRDVQQFIDYVSTQATSHAGNIGIANLQTGNDEPSGKSLHLGCTSGR